MNSVLIVAGIVARNLRYVVAPLAALAVVGAFAQTPAVSKPPASAATVQPAAGDAALKKTVEDRIGTPVDAVSKLPVGGLYEVRVGTDIFYTDASGNYIIVGNIIDLRTRENLTKKRVEALVDAATPKVKFADLPLDSAVKIVKGNGKRQLAIFEDPNCVFCKRLEKSLQEISDVTIYVFLYPILGPDSLTKSKQVWCAADRGRAWSDWMERGTALTGDGACATPLDKNLALGKKLRVDGTPTLFFSDGRRVPGAVPADELAKLLAG